MASPTPLGEISEIRNALRATFASGKTRDIAFRKTQLLQLAYLLQDNRDRFVDALKADLGRPKLETLFLELGAVTTEAIVAYKRVDKWAAPEGVPFNINTFAMFGKVYKVPKGTALIIGPFNYPLFCTLVPLIGAIAAGCTVVLKPSELVPATESLLVELIPKYLDQNCYRIVTGAIPETTKLLELQWDHIMYTGSGTVGKIVAAAAAKHLTPTTLELGGKSPVIVDHSADLKLTAKRVLWGKNANAGQTCVAPDYILVPKERQDALVEALINTNEQFYPKAEGGPQASQSFGRIVADRHFQRLKKLLESTRGEIVIGGETDAATRYIAPTVVKNVSIDDPLMAEELFGPILPIVPVENIQAAIDFINTRDHPLSAYVYTNDDKVKQHVFDSVQSGMAMVNDHIISAAVEGLPFGGVGPSGMGAHSDKAGFDQFTHRRSTIHTSGWLDIFLGFRFPPYTAAKEKTALSLVVPKIPFPRPGTKKPFNWALWGSLVAVASAAFAFVKPKALSAA